LAAVGLEEHRQLAVMEAIPYFQQLHQPLVEAVVAATRKPLEQMAVLEAGEPLKVVTVLQADLEIPQQHLHLKEIMEELGKA